MPGLTQIYFFLVCTTIFLDLKFKEKGHYIFYKFMTETAQGKQDRQNCPNICIEFNICKLSEA